MKKQSPMKDLIREIRAMARDVEAYSPGVKRKLRRTHDDIRVDEELMERGDNLRETPSVEQNDDIDTSDEFKGKMRLTPTPSQEEVLDVMEDVEEENEGDKGIEELEHRYASSKCRKGKGNAKSKKKNRGRK